MVRFWVLLLGICFVFAPSAFASSGSSLPLGTWDPSVSGAPLEISKTTLQHTSIVLSDPGVVSEERVVNYHSFQAFGIPGEPFILEEGVPTVPQVARFCRIPNTGGVDLVLTNTEDFELLENVDVMPFQMEGSDHFGLARSSVMDQDQWYPSSVAEMSEPMVMRDMRLVRVVLFPVQVNPVTHQARIYHNLQVDIVANDQPGFNEITNPRPISRDWARMYQSMISNLDDSALDDVTDTPGSLMIICKNTSEAMAWADSLRVWKKRKGFDVVVDARSNWTASSMVQAIQTAYDNWDPPLEFVALIGDPQWTSGVPTSGSDWDHAFALGNSADDLEDIGVGRLCGSSGSDMATINAKIMGYERNPYMQNSQGQADTMWFHKGFFYAGVSHNIGSNYTLMQWASHQFSEQTGIYQNTVAMHNGAVDQNLIQQQLNSGVSIFLWRGGWVYEMGTGVAGSCNNGWKLPITLTITCGTGDFQSEFAVSESWLVAGTPTNPRGGVCAMGTATWSTHAPYNITVAGGLAYNLADLHVEHIGHAVNGAKAWLTYLWGPSNSTAAQYSKWNNLLGDPSLSVWTDVPKATEAAHATTLNVGAHAMSVDVHYESTGAPVQDALVVLWKGTETYVRGLTDVNGHVDLPIAVQTSGDLWVTITKHNHKPYLYTVPCVTAEQMVAVSSYTIDDDNSGGTNGNSDGILNPGETIDLPTYLRNYGNGSTATNVSTVLTGGNPNIVIATGSSTYPNLAPGDSAQGATRFRIEVSPQMQNLETALLTLVVTASSVTTTSAVELTCHAGEPIYLIHLFTGTVNPGTTNNLRVTLQNIGTRALPGATGHLISLSPFVQVDDANGTFGDIAPGQQVNNSGDQFTLTSNTLTFRGHHATMRLIVTASDGFADTTQFTVSIGSATTTDPTGPDAYGYYAYDNTDASYEMYPTYSYVDISSIGENLGISDVGDPGIPQPNYSRVRALPFPFTFYGQSYDTITICSNGWMAFGNQVYLDLFRNYPIPAMLAPDAMIAPYWDDLRTNSSGMGVWKYNDTANHRCIIQWKAGVYTGGPSLDFEVILLDTAFYPTFDGSGKVIIQYNVVQMGAAGDSDEPNGCSIGIQAPGNVIGLPYAFLTSYLPGAATVTTGRAILFTTDARMLFGAVQGTVLDAETNQPMSNVDVTLDGYSYHTLTDASGHYLLDDVLIGEYTVRVHQRAFNDATVANIVVELDSTETVNFSMLHPELALAPDSIHVSVPEQPVQTSFQIANGGNGPLDYALTITYGGDESSDPWDYLDGISISAATGDYLVMGCEFAGDYWYVSGAGTGGGQSALYKFDTDGNYADMISQPVGGIGWFDLAYDGQYLYGSEQRSSGGGLITGIDLTGQVQTTVPSPVNPSRAIAYDPTHDYFWVADYSSDIFAVDRGGAVHHQIANGGNSELNVTGLAWNETDPEGYKLLIFAANGSGTQLWRLHPVSDDRQFVTTLAANPGEHAGGLAITPGWNSTLLVLGGILQGPSGDRLGIYEVTFNTTWIDVVPTEGLIPGSQSQEVSITFDPTYLRPDEYIVNLNIHSTVLDSTYVLPVVLAVSALSADPSAPAVPTAYSLYQNYPNPFNPSTTIRYDLKDAGHTRLTVYNLVGQQVAVLVDKLQPAGAYQLNFDGVSLPSGVYFYRLRSGSFVKSAKMVLMK